MEILCFTDRFLFIKSYWNSFCFFILSLYNFITLERWIIHYTCWIFYIFGITCRRIPNIIFFTHMTFFTPTLTLIHIPRLIWITFFSSNLHLHSHDICFVNFFDSFIPVIILNTLRFCFARFIWNTYFIR